MQLKEISKHKPDILCILIIAALSIFFLHSTIGTGKIMDNGHYLHEQTFFSYNYKDALKYHTLPFWTPYWYAGQPLYGDSQVFFFNLTFIFILIFKNIFLSIGLSSLVYFFLGCLGMYILARHFTKNPYAALASSVVFMFNGLIYSFVRSGNPSILEPYALIPFIFFFVLKATKSDNYTSSARYSIFAGIMLALQVFSGGMVVFIYMGILLGLFLFYNLIGSDFARRLKKTIVIGLIVGLVCIGVSAVKLLPNIDFIKSTNRANGVSYQEYIGSDILVLKDFFKVVPFNGKSSGTVIHIGIIAFLLVLLSAAQFKKKIVLFSFIIAVFSLLFASGGSLAQFFYHLPAFSQSRHVARILFLFTFAAAILSAYGFLYISEFVKSKLIKSSRLHLAFLFIIIAVIFAELVYAMDIPKGLNIAEQIKDNHAANYLAQEKEKFRISTFDVNDLVSFYGSSYYAQYGLETLSGGGGDWLNDYVEFTGIAQRYNPAKLQGILNVKYTLSTKEVNVTGFKLVRKFEDCKVCKYSDWTYWIGGPYLYENEQYMPRYYTVDNSILIVGNDADVKNVMYLLLLNPNFNPKTSVMIKGRQSINDYNIDSLRNYNILILTANSFDSSSMQSLDEYSKQNGIILPDITKNKFNIEQSELGNALQSLKGNITLADAKYFSPNKVVISPQKTGFLVLSEKFYMFPDWKATTQTGKNLEIMQSDGVISSVLLKDKEEITFTFKPRAFYNGLVITAISIVIIFIYLGFSYFKVHEKK